MFRLKLSCDESQSSVDVYVTPSTPLGPSGTFGVLEPAFSTPSSDYTIPSTDYKWNQIVELQLSDGKKVFFGLVFS